MPTRSDAPASVFPPRPIPESYWVQPGRLLVGEHPAYQSRSTAVDRLQRFLQAGITCFVDLTETREIPTYQASLPATSWTGRSIAYLREPIRDHGLPDSREVVARVLARIDEALAAGHVVYLHCRAGIGRSALVAGCWLASRRGTSGGTLDELQDLWLQSAKSAIWPVVPETEEQAAFVRDWMPAKEAQAVIDRPPQSSGLAERVKGALYGLAIGDAMGTGAAAGGESAGQWSQHTSLTLCLGESLLELGRFDARDQMTRYLRWQRDGHLSSSGRPAAATPDVARALSAVQWRRQPMAGSHDPKDRSTASLPRVLAAVLYGWPDIAAAVALSGECSRTTHQSPVIIDACRYYGALLCGALRGDAPRVVLGGLYEPVPGLWSKAHLKPDVLAMASSVQGRAVPTAAIAGDPDAVRAVAHARFAIEAATDFESALRRALDHGRDPAVDGALTGALAGALLGERALPPGRLAALARFDVLESMAGRFLAHLRADPGRGMPGETTR